MLGLCLTYDRPMHAVCLTYTVEPGISKLFEKRKNVYYCQVFTIYHVIYAMIVNFGKQQKVH